MNDFSILYFMIGWAIGTIIVIVAGPTLFSIFDWWWNIQERWLRRWKKKLTMRSVDPEITKFLKETDEVGRQKYLMQTHPPTGKDK